MAPCGSGTTAPAGELVVERAPAAFSEAFASVSRVAVPLVDGEVALTVWLDRCSVEVFADGGRVVLTLPRVPRSVTQST